MNEYTKLWAKALIGVGGSLVGLIAGWDIGPLTLELGRMNLALLGAVGTGLFVASCAGWAKEHADARADRERQFDRLTSMAKHVRAIRTDLQTLVAK